MAGLLRTDYPSFESALHSKAHKWCRQASTNTTPQAQAKDMIDIINVWIPTKTVQPRHLRNPEDMRRVRFCAGYFSSGAVASNFQNRPSMFFARNMSWGDAGLFRSANKEVDGVSTSYSPVHGAFRLGATPGARTSVELRCAVMKKLKFAHQWSNISIDMKYTVAQRFLPGTVRSLSAFFV
mgnify:CR=1 FL=1